ncbi:PEP-CTERM sorting domain-containing protein [Mucisphaera sp.]|uniref:PEP-CTERM sorting domain-containing protein n=1 Tax=Mucisphaera sp. TaxID=2913024 RepID=UPI003D0D3306
MSHPAITTAAALAAITLTAGQASAYLQVFPVADAQLEGDRFYDGAFSDGTNVYSVFRSSAPGDANGYITVFDGSTHSSAMTGAQWNALGAGDLAASDGARVVAGELRFVNFFTNEFYSVDLGTGTPSVVTTNADINLLVVDSSNFTAANTVADDGTIIGYESRTDQIVNETPSILLSSAALTSATGNDSVSGMTANGSDIIWGSNTSDELYSYDGTTVSTIMTEAEYTAFTGEDNPGFNDMIVGGDGLLYFYDTRTDAILSLDPDAAVPASTLAVVISEAELLAGPGNSDLIGNLTWYNGDIAWTVTSSSSGRVPGFYSIPEPASAALMGLAGLALIRRR